MGRGRALQKDDGRGSAAKWEGPIRKAKKEVEESGQHVPSFASASGRSPPIDLSYRPSRGLFGVSVVASSYRRAYHRVLLLPRRPLHLAEIIVLSFPSLQQPESKLPEEQAPSEDESKELSVDIRPSADGYSRRFVGFHILLFILEYDAHHRPATAEPFEFTIYQNYLVSAVVFW